MPTTNAAPADVTYVISKRTFRRVGTLVNLTRFFIIWQPLSGAPTIKESRYTGHVYVEELAPVVQFPGNRK